MQYAFSRRLGLCLALGLSMCCSVVSALADDPTAIRGAVFDYLDGINQVDRLRLERAFDPRAELKGVDDSGALVVEPIAGAIERWMRSEVGARRGEILSMDIQAGQIARVVFDFDGAYVDFLTLAKLNGQWKIIDKVFVRK